MNPNDVPISHLQHYLSNSRFEYFKNNGSLESISKIKGISFVFKSFEKKIFNNAKQLSFIQEIKEGFDERLHESFFIQQTIELVDNIDYNIRNLVNIVKKQATLYNFLTDIQNYNKISKSYLETLHSEYRDNDLQSDIVSLFCSRFQNVDLPKSELLNKELSEEDAIIFEKLQNLTHTILIYYIEKNNNYLVYGSYSLYLYNKNITYNDIDLYSADPAQIANILAFIAYWIYNVTINVHLNPLILHYISVEFRTSHVFDILYLNKELQIDYKEIKDNISILKIYIQFFNFFRSLTDFHRMKVFQENPHNTKLKLRTLIKDISLKYNIKTTNQNVSSNLFAQMRILKLYTLDNVEYLMIPTKLLPFKLPYSYIFIFITDYSKLIEALPNNSKFYKRHSGIYNELVAEVPQNADTNKRIRIKSFVTLNNDIIIPRGVEIQNIDLGNDFFDEIKKSSVLVLSNVYSKLFVDRTSSTLEPISFLNILASIGLALILNKKLTSVEERLFFTRMFEYMNCFTIDDTVEKLNKKELYITSKRRTREQHRSFQPAVKMSYPFSLFFERLQTKQNIFSKSEYLQYFQ